MARAQPEFPHESANPIGVFFCALVSLCVAAACSDAAPDAGVKVDAEARAAIAAAASADTAAERIKLDLQYLADDAREGRETGTKGHRAAANYVAARFAALGLAPGAGGGWFQETPLKSGRCDLAAARFEVRGRDGGVRRLKHLEDYVIGATLTARAFNVTAPVVFVGYGVSEPRAGYDDYAEIDVAGKIVAVFRGGPSSLESEIRAHAASTEEKRRNAAAHGAVGLITLPTVSSDKSSPWDRVVAHPDEASMTWIGPDGRADAAAPDLVATARLSAAGAAALFSGAAHSYAQLRAAEDSGAVKLPTFDLPDEATLAGVMKFRRETSPNVVGFLEGADPSLKNQVIVLSAHLDHEGVKRGRFTRGDLIYNGALDNAMGVATMIEAATAFAAAPRPRRSLLFLATTGEEQGLLGSDYFARFPTLEGRRMVADINLDMPLTLYPFTDVIAFGAERSTLGAVVAREAEAMGLALAPDPMPELGLFTRSDHYRFVEQGIPSIFLFTGFANGGEQIFEDFMRMHYHRPSDDLQQPIDYGAAARFAELNFRIARAAADSDSAPEWIDGDFFGALFGKERR